MSAPSCTNELSEYINDSQHLCNQRAVVWSIPVLKKGVRILETFAFFNV